MSYQVGLACYADLSSASSATCSQFSPVTSVTGGSGGAVVQASCSSANDFGVLTLKIVSSPINGDAPSVSYNTITPVYHPCQYSEYMDAVIAIGVAVACVWAACWGVYQLYKMMHWSRSDGT